MRTSTGLARVRLGYAINQWKPNFDDFTRREQHVRAVKTMVAAGFRGVELRAGSGRWDPLGRPASVAANYGSMGDFVSLLRDLGLDAVCSWYFDPGEGIGEELSHGRSILDPSQHVAIAGTLRPFAEALSESGGERLVVRALPSAWSCGPLSDGALAAAAAGWNAVGEALRDTGVRVSLHADCTSAAMDPEVLARLLDATDPEVVGLTVDTAEVAVSGQDPAAVIRRNGARLDHVQVKDTRHVDDLGERLAPHAEATMIGAGGSRQVDRWFYECGTSGGRVDFAAVVAALDAVGYDGWVVAESEQTPNPSSSVMLNGWYLHRLFGDRVTTGSAA